MAAKSSPSVIAIYNGCAGGGKTTSALNLGAQLATEKKRTLIIDCDPKCALTNIFFYPKTQYDREPKKRLSFKNEGISVYGVPMETEMPENKRIPSLPLIRNDKIKFRRSETTCIRTGDLAERLNLCQGHTINIQWCLDKAFKRENFIPQEDDLKPTEDLLPNLFILSGEESLDLNNMFSNGENIYMKTKAHNMPI